MRWRGTLWIVPVVATVIVFARRISRLETGPDAGVFTGMVRNLRSSFSLTSPTDQYWMRLSPAATVDHIGRLPVPDFGPLYSALVAIVPAPLDLAFVLVHCAALLVAVSAVGYLALRATQSVPMAVAAQLIVLWGPLAPDLFFPHGGPLDLYASFGSDGLAVALVLAGLAIVVAGPADDGTLALDRHRRGDDARGGDPDSVRDGGRRRRAPHRPRPRPGPRP